MFETRPYTGGYPMRPGLGDALTPTLSRGKRGYAKVSGFGAVRRATCRARRLTGPIYSNRDDKLIPRP